jgi:hypothetical protein
MAQGHISLSGVTRSLFLYKSTPPSNNLSPRPSAALHDTVAVSLARQEPANASS